MAGEGSMIHAIHTMRTNKALLKQKRGNWKEYIGTKKFPTEDHIKATQEQLTAIRYRLQKENKAILRKKIILTASIVGTVLIALIILNQF